MTGIAVTPVLGSETRGAVELIGTEDITRPGVTAGRGPRRDPPWPLETAAGPRPRRRASRAKGDPASGPPATVSGGVNLGIHHVQRPGVCERARHLLAAASRDLRGGGRGEIRGVRRENDVVHA